MNTNDPRFEIIRRCLDGQASAEELTQLESSLRQDVDFRESYVRYVNLDVALSTGALCNLSEEVSVPMTNLVTTLPTTMASVMTTTSVSSSRRSVWLSWRPLSAAAAGLLFGMFFTSVVYGFVSQRLAVLNKIAMSVYEPGMENAGMVLDRGVPHGVGQWGADFAAVVMTENGVQPFKGQRMLRLETIPRERNVKNLASRVYQVLDLRSLAMNGIVSDAEVLVSASFCPANADVGSRYLIRAFALKETPEQATKGFWPKTEDDGVVSVAQRFEVLPGGQGWHTFSLKMPLPRGAQSLVFVLGAVPPDDLNAEASQHYLDDVHVSVIASQSPLP